MRGLWPQPDTLRPLAYDFSVFLKRPLTDVSIPTGARWIPKGMSVEYLAKAKGNVRAVADGSAVDWASAGDKLVEVTALNEED
ncbi:hypothetical protein CJ307_33330, partial [Klebsiella quasipneumoniae]